MGTPRKRRRSLRTAAPGQKDCERADGVTAFVTPRRTCIGARTAQDPGLSRPFDASTKRTAGATDQASSMLKGTGLRMVLATGE